MSWNSVAAQWTLVTCLQPLNYAISVINMRTRHLHNLPMITAITITITIQSTLLGSANPVRNNQAGKG